MLKKEFISHYLATLIWLAILLLLRLIFHWSSFLTADRLFAWFLFSFGALIGTMLLDLDQIFYALLIFPEEKAREFWRQRKIKKLLEYLAETHPQRVRLPFHNAIFQVILLIFSFWAVTSTTSFLGKGLVMALNLHFLKDEIALLVKGREEQLRRWLFWPIKGEVSFFGQKIFVGIMGLGFLGLSLAIS